MLKRLTWCMGGSWVQLSIVMFFDRWVADSEVKACAACGSLFTQLRRKHHCRSCGHIYCSKCCMEKVLSTHSAMMCIDGLTSDANEDGWSWQYSAMLQNCSWTWIVSGNIPFTLWLCCRCPCHTTATQRWRECVSYANPCSVSLLKCSQLVW